MACAVGGYEDSGSDTEDNRVSAVFDKNCECKPKVLLRRIFHKVNMTGLNKDSSSKKIKSRFWPSRLRKKNCSKSKKKECINSEASTSSPCACNDIKHNDDNSCRLETLSNLTTFLPMDGCRSGSEGLTSSFSSDNSMQNEISNDLIIPSPALGYADNVLCHSSVGVHISRFLFQSLSNPLIISNSGSNVLDLDDGNPATSRQSWENSGLSYLNSFSSHPFDRPLVHDHFHSITAEQLLRLSEAITGQCVLNSAAYRQEEKLSGESNPATSQTFISLGPQSESHTACGPHTVHTQVDYVHCLVPDLASITNCSFYWGMMDRYEAEQLLENRPEGTFLLRDSVQEEFLFSVSFRRHGRSLHARVEQWDHKFSFDSHNTGVFASDTVTGLMEHYKDPSCCMFFEPMLTLPLQRSNTFSLQHLARARICTHSTYDGISTMSLPKTLLKYLKYYHYKQKVRVRMFDCMD